MTNTEGEQPITELLRRWSGGDLAAADQVMPLVYRELRGLARAQLRHERPDHTLQTTALVHEAYLRLVRGEKPEWSAVGLADTIPAEQRAEPRISR